MSPAPRLATLLDELWELTAAHGAEAAAERLRGSRGIAPRRSHTDWRQFLPLPAGGRVLEVGAGFGEDTLALCAAGARVVGLVPTEINARILERRLDEHGVTGATVRVVADLSRLPLPEASVDAVVLEDAAAPGFALDAAALPAALAEFDRVLAAEGVVLVGVRNAWRDLPGGGALWPAGRRESLNRLVKRGGGPPRPAFTRRRIEHGLRGRGFSDPYVLAPIPHEQAVEAVVPLRHPEPLAYCLNRYSRRNSLVTAAVLAAANAAAATDVLAALLPYFYLLFRRSAPAA